MKRPPSGASFEKVKIKKKKFLESVLKRLEDDVGLYFDALPKISPKKAVGFWASLRLILPIIEAVSHAVGEKPQEFLSKYFDVKAPYLTWDLFRHSLIHGDYIHHGKYKNKEISWGVLIYGSGHIYTEDHIGIDSLYLYKKLVDYLKREIAKNESKIVEIEVGVIYIKPKKEIIKDFLTFN